MSVKVIIILVFLLVIVCSLIFDLGILSKQSNQTLTLKQSIFRSLGWFGLGLSSVVAVYFLHHHIHGIQTVQDLQKYSMQYNPGLKIPSDYGVALHNFQVAVTSAYLSGFLLEYALSVDNLFVMLLIFQTFKVSHHNENRILLWGVLGAMVLRFVFVVIGSAAITQFHWILYAFGLLLIYSGIKLMLQKEDDEFDAKQNPVVKWAHRLFTVNENPSNPNHFFSRDHGKFMVTPLFIVLLVIEFTDVLFAVDSVPAVFGVTTDPYLVFFSNIFAILGLRSLYFLLGYGMDKFYALKYGLSIILVYIGLKMLLEDYALRLGFTHTHNLLVIIGILFVSIFYSLIFPQKNTEITPN